MSVEIWPVNDGELTIRDDSVETDYNDKLI